MRAVININLSTTLIKKMTLGLLVEWPTEVHVGG